MTSAADPQWYRMAALVKVALRWAWAAARVRGADAVEVDDLLIGVVLADRVDNPARQLFEHFAIPPSEVLAVDPPTASALLATIDGVPHEIPPLHPTASAALDAGPYSGGTRSDGDDRVLTLRGLLGGLLTVDTPLLDRFRGALDRRGVDLALLVGAYREYARGRQPLVDYLRDSFSHRPPGVELPGYLADQPLSRVDDPEDFVGIGPEVDAFAHLMASKRLVPPLAVGLFGDWGSGKSFFLRRLQRRIDQLAAAARPDGPFHRSVVQIEFNAWQYVGGDLWAGLVEHIFRNLRTSGDDNDDLLAERQGYWVRQLQGVTDEHEQARAAETELTEERAEAEAAVTEREQERGDKLAVLERKRRDKPLAGWRPSEEVRTKVVEAAGLTEVVGNGKALSEELDRAREDLRGLGAVLAPLREGGWKYAASVVALVVLAPVVTFLVGLVDLSGVTGAVAGVLTTVTGYLAVAGRYVRSATKKIADAQAELAADEDRQREELDEQVRLAEGALAEAERELAAARERERAVAERLAEVTAALEAATPRQVLTDFINERLDSDDYRKHLGVPALVRRDLDRLSRLVAEQHRNPEGDPVPGQYAMDRVVLYIDDLDRCPPSLVVKVLEAVHLLLAFPLFVVVVAVDARWLESSLRLHHEQLADDGAGPEDYLEKVFQVPFRLPPLDAEVRRRMLRGLLTPSLRVEPAATAPGEAARSEPMADTDLREFREVVASFSATRGRTGPEAVDLTVTDEEVDRIAEAVELIGATPRAVKRFVNTYLLLRSMGAARGLPLPERGALVLLLALAVDRPEVDTGSWVQERPELARLVAEPGPWHHLISRFRFARG